MFFNRHQNDSTFLLIAYIFTLIAICVLTLGVLLITMFYQAH